MDTLQPNVGAAISSTYSLALVAFVLRIYARSSSAAPYIAGDWISGVSFVGSALRNIYTPDAHSDRPL